MANTASGTVGGSVVQGRDFTAPVTVTSHPGDQVTISGEFQAPVVGKQEIHHDHGAAPRALAGLPVLPAGFAGREEVLGRLLAVLDPSAGVGVGVVVSAVAGMGGVGKSTLAAAADHQARARGWFSATVPVDLRGHSAEGAPMGAGEALETVLRLLGVAAIHIPPTVEERAALYRSRLEEVAAERGGPVLVVADNARDRAQVHWLLPGVGGHRLLVTSRYRLVTLGAAIIDLDVLAPEAAVEVLRVELRTANPADGRADDADGLARLAAACGGLPLALQITAALLVRSRSLRPGRLAERLTDTATRLTRLDDGERTLRATFDLSHQQLSPQQARVFALLALNPGPDISTPAAAALADLAEDDAAEVLLELADAHLLREDPQSGRWSMHDLVAAYAHHHLHTQTETDPAAADYQDQARTRLFAHYIALADAADDHLRALPGDEVPEVFAGREEALAWLDAERPNLIATTITAQATGHTTTAIRLPLLLAYYLDWRRYFDDQITLSTIARDTAHHTGDHHREARAWNNLGTALRQVRRFDEAIHAHQQARTLHQEVGDRHREATAWNNLGLALRQVRRFDEAIHACEQARTLHQEVGDRHREATAWNNLGLALRQVRRFDEAIHAHEHARNLFREVGDRHGEAMAWNNLGLALQASGQVREAVAAAEHAVALYTETGDAHRSADAQNLLDELRRTNDT
ncbi:tetratricopeptide repeat protein [Allonocardiopsis opalescens]|nr:tetratricopeptide repeat protein [Allonocardiopsis opalescens]